MDCPIPQDQLDEIYAFAIDLARKAGQLLLERIDERNADQVYTEKENAVDLVTQTDEGMPPFSSSWFP
jgi:myo-inositol-1(or 4)-monophosphatase